LDNGGKKTLEAVNEFFDKSGTISAPSKGAVELVFGQKALIGKIIPFLKDHPLMGGKALALAILIKVIKLKKVKAHRNPKI